MNLSERLFEKASGLMPGGVNSPVRAFRSVGKTPFFVEKAAGPYLYDVDGNRYTDYVCSFGPCILGHAHPQVVEAVQKACADGLTFGAPTQKEAVLAELIRSCAPDMEMLRMVSSGTEAVMSAVRLARGFTGREKIIKFAGNYHGHSDGLLVKAGSGMMTGSVPDSSGVPEGYAQSTLTAVYNDADSAARLFAENPGQVAAVVVEPVAANMGVVPPAPGFLEALRLLTRQNGALLIFDEVITGFRLALGGATEFTGVHADLHTFGKIAGGGMPLAVYGGRADIMSLVAPLGPVYQAGTLSGNPVAVTAGIETVKILMEHPELYGQLEEAAIRLETACRRKGLCVNRAGGLLSAFFSPGREKRPAGGESDQAAPVRNYEEALRCDTQAYADFFSWMLQNGIYIAPSQFEAIFISAAHNEEIIAKTCEVIEAWNG